MTPTVTRETTEIRTVAEKGYLFGYPLMMMDMTRRVGTNVPGAGQNAAPLNQFGQKREFPDDTFRTVVSPNADTLYSFAFLDLLKEPVVLSLPAMGTRYYLMPMLDAWTNVFASPGTRTTGQGKADLAITGPGWSGKLPAGVQQIKAPTNLVWIIGRTQTNGKRDFRAVHDIQDQYKLTPLSAWGHPYSPPTNVPTDPRIDMKTAPVEQVAKMDEVAFFARLAMLMKDNPPAAADAPVLKELAGIGVVPGQTFDVKNLDADAVRALREAVAEARKKIVTMGSAPPRVKMVNGWSWTTIVGTYGTDYEQRAAIAMGGLGANSPDDAIYPFAFSDADGKALNGANRYVIHFDVGQMPPVKAFWSVTMYDTDHFMVANPIKRYAIGDRDSLRFGSDGSLDLYIQRGSPGPERESNWLPAPASGFNMILRMYWPKQAVLDGIWKPPAVRKVG